MNLRYTFRALRHRNYRLFFTGQSLSLIGTWLQQVAMGWLVYRLTDSALLLGLVAFCANFGILLFSAVGGVLADRVDRRRALLVTQGLMLVQALVLATLVATDLIQVWHLIGLALWLGTVSAFDLPLRQSMYVQLVDDRADLPNAIALNSFIVNGARVVGPALAGALLAVTSEAVCFAFNALSFVAVIIAIARIHWPRSERPSAPQDWWLSWVEGLRFALGFAPTRSLLILVGVLAWTISPYAVLMPVYAKAVYGGGPGTLGGLLAAAGAGALASTLYLAGRQTIVGLGTVIAGAALVSGAALAGFAYLRILPLAWVAMALAGGGLILAAAGTNIVLQTIVEDRLRGRVAGFYTMAFLGIAPIGALVSGAMAGRIGIEATFLANGAVCVIVAAWFWSRVPGLRVLLRPRLTSLGLLPDDS